MKAAESGGDRCGSLLASPGHRIHPSAAVSDRGSAGKPPATLKDAADYIMGSRSSEICSGNERGLWVVSMQAGAKTENRRAEML
jgi:hypothetical protein